MVFSKYIHNFAYNPFSNYPCTVSTLCAMRLLVRRVAALHCIYVKVTFSRYRPGVAQRVGRVIALLFYDRGTRRG